MKRYTCLALPQAGACFVGYFDNSPRYDAVTTTLSCHPQTEEGVNGAFSPDCSEVLGVTASRLCEKVMCSHNFQDQRMKADADKVHRGFVRFYTR